VKEGCDSDSSLFAYEFILLGVSNVIGSKEAIEMADMSFDMVIVGGGCKGLSTGLYLAKYGGMSVGIFEALHELGGGLAGE
jgi:ribulose 1,5-bisphosphate synthetase/thiazole synthase